MLSSMFKKTWVRMREKKPEGGVHTADRQGHAQLPDGQPADTDEQKQTGANIPAGLWKKCNSCGKPIYTEDVKENFYVCPKCGGYFRVSAYNRIEMLADAGSFEEWDSALVGGDPLSFPGYPEKLAVSREKSGLHEAVVTGRLTIAGQPAAVGVMDARFMMASMGYAVGEKLTRLVERATVEKLPVIIYTASGGARMQEGIISLMQMAKTASALKQHSDAGLFSVMVLTNPTTGGVTASFAMLGDVILAEPGALIGFAGPRVIEQTIRKKLPEGFQTAEFLLEHGFADRVVPRSAQRAELAALLSMHAAGNTGAGVLENCAGGAECKNGAEIAGAVLHTEKQTQRAENSAGAQLTAWERVKRSRSAGRPTALDYIDALFQDFLELHGDRAFGDDGAVVGGIARLGERPVTVIGIQKGRTIQDNMKRNFGMPEPEGYRKALRLMKQAEKFGRPVICLIDTPGAYPGKEAEERGQGQAIAENLYEMSGLKVPVLSILIGEGGSGGALALAVTNEVWMYENAVYAILSPEGFASILYKDASKAEIAAARMKITAQDLLNLHVIERILPEPEDYTAEALREQSSALTEQIEAFLEKRDGMTPEEIVKERRARFRRF